jgi:hypothetical protein
VNKDVKLRNSGINRLSLIKNKNVDKSKWDALVSRTPTAYIFSVSDYLNSFCNWDCIILDDYSGGIALPVTKKLGFNSIWQPVFIQKNCWIGEPLPANLYPEFWQLIKSEYRHIHFNSNLNLAQNAKKRINLTLNITTHKANTTLYSKSLRKNVSKAKDLTLRFDNTQVEASIAFYRAAYGAKNEHITQHHYTNLAEAVGASPQLFENVVVYHGLDPIAGLLFAKYHNRLHYVLGAPNDIGRKLNALSFALDALIKQYEGKDYVLDFEGSMIPSVRDFYSSFGSQNEPFYEIKWSTPLVRILSVLYNKFIKS